jgi:hypothetical protein
MRNRRAFEKGVVALLLANWPVGFTCGIRLSSPNNGIGRHCITRHSVGGKNLRKPGHSKMDSGIVSCGAQ